MSLSAFAQSYSKYLILYGWKINSYFVVWGLLVIMLVVLMSNRKDYELFQLGLFLSEGWENMRGKRETQASFFAYTFLSACLPFTELNLVLSITHLHQPGLIFYILYLKYVSKKEMCKIIFWFFKNFLSTTQMLI